MTHEIVEHAARMLRCEPTRTLSASALHRRTCGPLGVVMSYARFLALITDRPDLFTIIHDRALTDGWSGPERSEYAAALERVGFVRGPTVVLAVPAVVEATADMAAEEPDASLSAVLGDAHAAVLELFELEASTGGDSASLVDAAVQLEELRLAFAAQRRRVQL